MARILIGLGANLGDPRAQLEAALERLAALGRLVAVSSAYRTEPVGGVRQPDFLNAVCLLESDVPAPEMLARTQAIEADLGRVRTVLNGPRTMDLDLLDHGGQVTRGPALTLPHPAMASRAFVLVPLVEILPEWRHPALGRSARELLEALLRGEAVEPAGALRLPARPWTGS